MGGLILTDLGEAGLKVKCECHVASSLPTILKPNFDGDLGAGVMAYVISGTRCSGDRVLGGLMISILGYNWQRRDHGRVCSARFGS